MILTEYQYPELRKYLIEQFLPGSDSLHGPAHWERVERNALVLAEKTGAKVEVLRLFALFHDSRRFDDLTDEGHGQRGAELAIMLRGQFFDLDDKSFELLEYACIWHTDQKFSSDTTIGTCWDADRLDLGRVGIIPHESYMSTAFGKEVAKAGSFYKFTRRVE